MKFLRSGDRVARIRAPAHSRRALDTIITAKAAPSVLAAWTRVLVAGPV